MEIREYPDGTVVISLISFERQDDSCRPAFFPAA